ncbi:hypothetical protein JNUCC41_18405 [Brevibacillus sp. JNUCC-41]|nr:hypothetical protein JNUCC41_18405 [Brevibacillus sp. JNUCC-41]
MHYYNHQRIKVKLKHTKISSADQGIAVLSSCFFIECFVRATTVIC